MLDLCIQSDLNLPEEPEKKIQACRQSAYRSMLNHSVETISAISIWYHWGPINCVQAASHTWTVLPQRLLSKWKIPIDNNRHWWGKQKGLRNEHADKISITAATQHYLSMHIAFPCTDPLGDTSTPTSALSHFIPWISTTCTPTNETFQLKLNVTLCCLVCSE